MIFLFALIFAVEPEPPPPPRWLAEDTALVAERIAREIPKRPLTVAPPENRSSEHLDLASLRDALTARLQSGPELTLHTTVYLLAEPRRYVVLAELLNASEKVWLFETSVAKPTREIPSLPRWNDDDSRATVAKLFAACLAEGWLADEPPRPTLAVDPVQNRTDEHAPTALFRFALERAVLTDGRFRLMSEGASFTLRTTLESTSQWSEKDKRTHYRARLEAIRASDGHVSCVHTAKLTKTR